MEGSDSRQRRARADSSAVKTGSTSAPCIGSTFTAVSSFASLFAAEKSSNIIDTEYDKDDCKEG